MNNVVRNIAVGVDDDFRLRERVTAESEMSQRLTRAFITALVLTGSMKTAEAAVLSGIGALEFDNVSGDCLLLETAKSAIQLRLDLPGESDLAFSVLPIELRSLLLLSRSFRDCFVLRILLGVTPEICSGILHLSVPEVEDALSTGLQHLPVLRVVAHKLSISTHDTTVDHKSISGVTHGC